MSSGSPVAQLDPPNVTAVYAISLGDAASSGFASPFLGIYALGLGATGGDLGWITSVTSLLQGLLQVPFGRLSDILEQRRLFILFGNGLAALLWFPMLWATSPWQLIPLIALQAIFGAIAAPAWLALIADLAPFQKRGELSGIINTVAAFGSLLATLLAGILISLSQASLGNPYFLPFGLATVTGVCTSFAVFSIREPVLPRSQKHPRLWPIERPKNIGRAFRTNPAFLRFLTVTFFFYLVMAFAWPLFSIAMVDRLHATAFDIGMTSMISGVSMVVCQPYLGRLSDRIGRKSLLMMGHLPLFLVPLFYAAAPSLIWIYVVNVIIGILTAAGNAGLFPYLYDIVQETKRGESIAIYNAATGISVFIGAILGGGLYDLFVSPIGATGSLAICLLISAIGRLTISLGFFGVSEPTKFPATLTDELHDIQRRVRASRRRLQRAIPTSRRPRKSSSKPAPPDTGLE